MNASIPEYTSAVDSQLTIKQVFIILPPLILRSDCSRLVHQVLAECVEQAIILAWPQA